MINPTVAFLNVPWFDTEPPKDGVAYMRRGIRAGSRWPFTSRAHAAPGSKNVQLGSYLPMPFFLSSAAAWTQRAFPEAHVILRDSVARYESIQEFSDWWCAATPTHVIIETGTPCWENDYSYIKQLKKSNPACFIAIAGPNTREVAAHPVKEVDAYIYGEYDKGAAAFVGGKRGVIPFNPLSREELRNVPYPMFDEPVAHYYADSNPGKHPWPELTVWASRGCNFRCNFCSFPATMTNDDPTGEGVRKIRYYDPAWLEGFIRHRISVAARSGLPLQAVRFDGDTENSSDRHTREICRIMRAIKLPWSMMCRADTSSREVWQEMKDSGCFGVKIGFESASDRVVNQLIGKKLNLKEAEDTCRFLRSIGMAVHSTWMLGQPGSLPAEDKLTIDTIRRFYVENVHTSHQLSGCATVDGTPLANSVITDPNFVRDGDGQHRIETILSK